RAGNQHPRPTALPGSGGHGPGGRSYRHPRQAHWLDCTGPECDGGLQSITQTAPPPFIPTWNKPRRSDVVWALAPPRILGTDRPRPLQGRQRGTLAAGGGGGVKRLGSKKRLDGTGSLRISPSAAARQQRGDPNGIEDVGGGVGLKHATLRRIGGRRAGLLDRPLP